MSTNNEANIENQRIELTTDSGEFLGAKFEFTSCIPRHEYIEKLFYKKIIIT